MNTDTHTKRTSPNTRAERRMRIERQRQEIVVHREKAGEDWGGRAVKSPFENDVLVLL